MKVKLLKDHVNNLAGEILDVTEDRGKYLIAVKAAEPTTEKPKAKTEKVKAGPPKKEKNTGAGPVSKKHIKKP